MHSQVLLGGESGINGEFGWLPLMVVHCERRWEIYRPVWLLLGFMFLLYFANDGRFYLARVNHQSRECTECREPLCLELLHIFGVWTSRACCQVIRICIWSSVLSCLVAIGLQILVLMKMPIAGVNPFQHHVVQYSPL